MQAKFRVLTFLTWSLSFLLTFMAQAQTMQWGTGMAMGMQGCSYQQKAGFGATSESDIVSELQQEQKALKQSLQEKQKKQKSLERELEKLHATIEESLNSDVTEFAFSHMENGNRCEDYQDKEMPEPESRDLPPAEGPRARSENHNKLPTSGLSVAGLARYCDLIRAGTLRTDICSDARYRSSENKRGEAACKKALPDYRKKYVESQKLADDIDRNRVRLENLTMEISEARKEAREDRQNGGTEADVCLECLARGNGYESQQNQKQSDWAGVAANVGTGLAAMYMGYQQNKMVAEYNSELGWPTQSYPTWGYGLPYMAAGIYGAMGGGTGQGAFGCGSAGGMPGGMYGGLYGNMSSGAFGYPQSMYGTMAGGGMYSGGYGPWGMSGMGSMSMNSSSLSMQTQMYQTYLQQQQQYMQNYQARAQTMTGLQSELSSLLYRIQQVQYGNYYGTGTTSTSYLTGTTSYTSSPYIPIPASSTSNTNYYNGSLLLPATSSGSVVIPATSR